MIVTLPWTTRPPKACRGGAVTIGNFDGVHQGHASLLQRLRAEAARVGGPAVAVSFDPHPLQLLRPANFLPLLTTANDRAELLRQCGADGVVILETTRDLLQLSAGDFFQQVIRDRLDAQAVVEGTNFGFGRHREGNVELLGKLCEKAGLSLTIVPPLLMEGRPVSSSRVRTALERGAVTEAAALLGRTYRLHGIVGTGQRRGSTLGFPTANLERLETVVPGDGVYAVRVHHEHQVWPGAANIGPNPTFGEHARKVEVHLIGFVGDLVGRPLAVDFVERLRDTQRFAGVAQLVEQLRADVERARQLAEL